MKQGEKEWFGGPDRYNPGTQEPIRRTVRMSPTWRCAEWRASTDLFCLEERSQGDHPTRGDPKGGHLHRHAHV